MAKNDNKQQPILIRRSDGEDSEEGGHSGGAWKIAYADFMTAMMSFFLVMWLLNATTDEQRRGIAQFFNPMADRDTHAQPTDSMLDVQPSPLWGGSAIRRIKNGDTLDPVQDGAPGARNAPRTVRQDRSSDDITLGLRTRLNPSPPAIVPIGGPQTGAARSVGYIGAGSPAEASAEEAAVEQMASGLRQAIQDNPEIRDAASDVSIQIGRDDIRIELRDSNNTPMFDSGSATPNRLGKQMLAQIAAWLAPMPEPISIVGYTDGAPYHVGRQWGMSNWTLSVMRADHARETLVQAGYPDRNILDVSGRSDRDLALPSDPSGAGNRRVVLIMHRRFSNPAGPAPVAGAPGTPASPAKADKPEGTAGAGAPK
ncbi:OmpA/MotB domain protein [Gluconacetobacter diazotrophicus PA1 5]|uniref:OmpA family protein n=2 Tax=Gluconacetobacter diazotrophicus TaxID=33996 RepID=A0A7W4FE18_GLUDI|nr:flagellar motor protein MotB [Gluconacetobacter diazotrophicus]ACI53178.1 OmpA/MotB domain protein [Gluconacetobacter diazotrophicus PA1 5]MBB2156071.1 OmpA family protein [Gluconacetobacter diazotrophicus]TWB10448.1 chemotaxis protein MotB [Gluconacetobacter diazotrophicus]CAP55614.1 putative chemotaxis protein motB (Motility protein B) [Gluconacetobacter diazotrophicus PA1 5]